MTTHLDPANWPGAKVERRKTSALVPYARNPRTHTPEQVSQIAASIREWGWTMPVLIDEAGMLIAGHGRVLAAQKLRLPEVPVMIAVGWSEAQKRAYVIADNQLTLASSWDKELLAVELRELKEANFDLGLTGLPKSMFGDDEAEAAMPSLIEQDERVVDEDRFLLLVLCGDEQTQGALFESMKAEGRKVKVA